MTTQYNRCEDVKRALVETRFDSQSRMPSRDDLRHAEECDDCRAFAAEFGPLAGEIHRFKKGAFEKLGSTPEGRARARRAIERLSVEDSGVRHTSSRKASRSDADGWASRFFTWAFPGTPGVAYFRLVVQGVCGLGLVLFIAFVVHFSMSKRPVADNSKTKNPTAVEKSNDGGATSRPTSEPTRSGKRK